MTDENISAKIPLPQFDDVFESEEKLIAMVRDSGEDISESIIIEIYQTMQANFEEERKDGWSFWRFTEDWQIPLKISPRKYRPFSEVMYDVAELWFRSDASKRDVICRMFFGIKEQWDFYEIMDCCHPEMFRADSAEIDKDSVFCSPERLYSALAEAMQDERSIRFIPPFDYVSKVYRYIVFGVNRARADQELKDKLLQLNIDVDKPFCEVFAETAHSYYATNGTNEHIEIQRAFWFGVSFDALMFVNVMDRVCKYIIKETLYERVL